MRITSDLNRNLLAALEQIRQQDNVAVQQLASGRRVQTPSDDPAAAAAWVGNRAEYSATDQFSRNISGLQVTVQSADSALNSVVTTLTRAISLGTQGATGTVSSQDRLGLAQDVSSIQGQLVDLANTSVHGVYLFAGTAVTTQPYVLDPTAPAGVQYAGNGNATSVEIAQGQNVQIQLPGSQLFSAPGADAFLAIQNLIGALKSGGNIAGATTDVQKALTNISVQRISLGSTLARLNQASQSLNSEKLLLTQQENDLVGADLAQAATNFTQTQTALNAALQAGGKVSQLSLLDFLH